MAAVVKFQMKQSIIKHLEATYRHINGTTKVTSYLNLTLASEIRRKRGDYLKAKLEANSRNDGRRKLQQLHSNNENMKITCRFL